VHSQQEPGILDRAGGKDVAGSLFCIAVVLLLRRVALLGAAPPVLDVPHCFLNKRAKLLEARLQVLVEMPILCPTLHFPLRMSRHYSSSIQIVPSVTFNH
jgi:hypothetical protein